MLTQSHLQIYDSVKLKMKGKIKMIVKFKKALSVTIHSYFGVLKRDIAEGYTRKEVKMQYEEYSRLGYKVIVAPRNSVNKKMLIAHIVDAHDMAENRRRNYSIRRYIAKYKINKDDLGKLLQASKKAEITLDDLLSFCEDYSS